MLSFLEFEQRLDRLSQTPATEAIWRAKLSDRYPVPRDDNDVSLGNVLEKPREVPLSFGHVHEPHESCLDWFRDDHGRSELVPAGLVDLRAESYRLRAIRTRSSSITINEKSI